VQRKCGHQAQRDAVIPVQVNAAIFGDHQAVCKVSTYAGGVRCRAGFGSVRTNVRFEAQVSKVRFADHPTRIRGSPMETMTPILRDPPTYIFSLWKM
jgi:hypothetical protein